MSEVKQKILFVNSEIATYLPSTEIADIGRYLPQGVQERKREIRSFMPRYGCINERRNQLHEVIRLSGMNIIIDDVDRPLIIKVASISAARMQVYFIDNEDYFRRKQLSYDDLGLFFEDNDQRAIFFARGVLETVKKLRWAPSIIHCQGWISQLVPIFLKKAYKDDPIFSQSKIVLSLYDDTPICDFDSNFAKKACFGSVKENDLALLKQKSNGINLAKTAIQYSDGIILASSNVNSEIVDYAKFVNIPILEYSGKNVKDAAFIDEYCSFYDSL